MKIVKTKEPVLKPNKELSWASGAVFNPGAWYDNGKVHLLFRSIPKGYKSQILDDPNPGEPEMGFDNNYVSSIGYASSVDGINFEWRREPFISPGELFNKYGAEDARISKIDDDYLITYTALSRPAFDKIDGVRIGLAVTKDFKNIHKHGIAGPPNLRDKDAVIFPKKINGKIVMLHRIVPDIQLVTFDSLNMLFNPHENHWKDHIDNLEKHVIMKPEYDWESKKIGAGPTPIETDEGWLLIYHGVDENHVYRMGAALLDLNNPAKIIARSPKPLMEPELDFELNGDVPNVVFPEGAVVIDGMLHIYYGASDSVIGHAKIALNELVEGLLKYKL
jgi:predicted GH43/DUF377 family glycosyl hydrolase